MYPGQKPCQRAEYIIVYAKGMILALSKQTVQKGESERERAKRGGESTKREKERVTRESDRIEREREGERVGKGYRERERGGGGERGAERKGAQRERERKTKIEFA